MQKIEKIIIVGGDEVALLVAATIAFNVRHIQVVLVDSHHQSRGSYVESSMENISASLALAGIDFPHFIAATQATIKLGNHFKDWVSKGHWLRHAFGEYGITSDNIDFHQALIRLYKEGMFKPYADFSVAAVAAAAGRFSSGNDHVHDATPKLAAGLHFSIPAFIEFLNRHVQRLGVVRINGQVAKVNINDDGQIASLITTTSQKLMADFYIDCSGSSSQLLGDAMGIQYIDWGHALKVNRSVGVLEPAVGAMSLLAEVEATKNGWLRKIRLRDFSLTEFFYRAEDLTVEQARAELGQYVQGKQVKFLNETVFFQGRRTHFWEKNCLAIGSSAVSLAQFSHSSLFMAQAAATRFLDYFPSRSLSVELINEYNRLAINEVEQIFDYHCLHYYLLNKQHPLTINSREFLSGRLQDKIDMFQASGRLISDEGDRVIDGAQWIALLLGMGVLPDRYDPTIDNISIEQLNQASDGLRMRIQEKVSAMQSHEQYLGHLIHNSKRNR